MVHSSVIAVAASPEIPFICARAQELADRLGLPVTSTMDASFPLVLTVTHEHLELRQSAAKGSGSGPVFVDFVGGAMAFRRLHGGGRKQELGRAVGLKGNRCPTVVDATGGLARDAFVLASLGCRVTLIERSPVIAALVADGLTRANDDPVVGAIINDRLRLLVGDSCSLLGEMVVEQRPEVVYLDPMYPHRTKSALVKKEMRILRLLVGDDPDAPKLLAAALACARERVVVKRPIKAEPITGPTPSMAIIGKTGRFDVYLIRP
ncbi:MAG: class I SAM-dependent methyltransferase [Proteobacteria bacterium]|nr:class I SAM-dependent methyltransferase [Desulfobulbaceae bacterium]MBU4153060.1 class I SAM-dependent methyltransferase [Pseudomonadota bacterium]